MGLGDMMGKAAGALGGETDVMGLIEGAGIDPSALADMDVSSVTTLLQDKGIDLSMLEGLGLSVEDIIAKVTGG